MAKVYVLGSINTDLVLATDRIPDLGETLKSQTFDIFHGGKGANQAVAAAKLGADVAFCGCLGDDPFGQKSIDNLKHHSIDVSHVMIMSAQSSGLALIILSDHDNRIMLVEGANGSVTKQQTLEFLEDAHQGDILLVQAEIPVDVVEQAMIKAKQLNMRVVYNPAPADQSSLSLMSYVDVLVLNSIEALMLSQQDIIEEQLRHFHDQGIEDVIITLGSKGVMHQHQKEIIKRSVPKVSVLDTTGAGDAFCGSLVYGMAIGTPMDKAIEWASLYATYTVMRRGTQSSYPSLDTFMTFVKENRHLEL